MREERLVGEQGQRNEGWVVLVADKAIAMAEKIPEREGDRYRERETEEDVKREK